MELKEEGVCSSRRRLSSLMVKAVLAMLDNLGVEAASIHYDDFGS